MLFYIKSETVKIIGDKNLLRRINYKRAIIYLIGLNTLALGTVLFACGKLGVSALVSVPQVMANFLPLTLGNATTFVFLVLVIIEAIILGRIKWQIPAQFILSFIFGWIVDFYGLTVGLEYLVLNTFLEKIIMTLLAIICTSIGIFMMVKSDFVLIPPDGVVDVISQKINMQFGKIKFCFDFSMIFISITLSLLFIGKITAIGIGTILAVIFVGQLINVWEHLFTVSDATSK